LPLFDKHSFKQYAKEDVLFAISKFVCIQRQFLSYLGGSLSNWSW